MLGRNARSIEEVNFPITPLAYPTAIAFRVPPDWQELTNKAGTLLPFKVTIAPMRSVLIIGVLIATLTAQTLTPRKIAAARVFAKRGQVGLFIASSDGSDERRLLDSNDSDYDPVWAPDGASVVFTSDRAGSADLF